MGADASKNRRYRDEEVYEESGQFTETQVGHLLEEQKIFYEQKMAKLRAARENQRLRPQSVVISSSAQANAQSFAAPVYQRETLAAASSSAQSSPQTPGAPRYPRPQPGAVGNSTPTSPLTYGAPLYPSLSHGNTPMPVFISSPSAPPLESAALFDRPRAPYSYTQNDFQQRATLNVPAQTMPPPKSAFPSGPHVEPPASRPHVEPPARRPHVEPPASRPHVEPPSSRPHVEPPASRPHVEPPARRPHVEPPASRPQPGTTNSSDYVFVNSRGETERSQTPTSQGRDRSASRSRQKKSQEDDEIKCPTCKRTYGLTIFNCPNGHSSCNDCKRNERACGICYRNITSTRNITLEAYIAERKAHCPNSEEGCCLYVKLADMESHIKECPFREMPCPVDSVVGQCTWKGKLSEVAAHFDAFHPMQRQGNVDTEMYLHINSGNLSSMNTTHIARLIVIGSYNFLFHLRLSQPKQKVYAAVGLLGTAYSAAKWTYEVHIYNKREPRRKYQHIDVCYPGNTKVDDIFNESKCAAIPVSYASTFVNDNKLTFKFYIKKEFNEKPFKNNRGRGRGVYRR